MRSVFNRDQAAAAADPIDERLDLRCSRAAERLSRGGEQHDDRILRERRGREHRGISAGLGRETGREGRRRESSRRRRDRRVSEGRRLRVDEDPVAVRGDRR